MNRIIKIKKTDPPFKKKGNGTLYICPSDGSTSPAGPT
jgi:hypothetical protein